jgi:surfeit locus 1 family protein
MNGYVFKPRLWPTIITVPLLACLIALGNWQLERLDWKLDLIEKIKIRATQSPMHLPSESHDLDQIEYYHALVFGKFDHNKEVTMYSVGPNGEPGYDLYTPMMLIDGRSIIVNRGWVPEQIKDQNNRLSTIVSGDAQLSGLLRKPWSKLWYGPENEPENNMWFYGDVDAMASQMELNDYYPMYLYADKIDSDNGFPVAGRTEFNIVNNHLDYVLTWYGMAIVLVGIYLIAHIHKKED